MTNTIITRVVITKSVIRNLLCLVWWYHVVGTYWLVRTLIIKINNKTCRTFIAIVTSHHDVRGDNEYVPPGIHTYTVNLIF